MENVLAEEQARGLRVEKNVCFGSETETSHVELPDGNIFLKLLHGCCNVQSRPPQKTAIESCRCYDSVTKEIVFFRFLFRLVLYSTEILSCVGYN